MVQSGHYNISAEPWSAKITPVDLGWRIEKHSKSSLELNRDCLFPDEPELVLSNTTPPYKTVSVDFDGDCHSPP